MDNSQLKELLPDFTIENWETVYEYRNSQQATKEVSGREKLESIWFQVPEVITKEYCIQLLTQLDARQFIGNDYDKWVDNQVILFGDLDTAFNEIVTRFL